MARERTAAKGVARVVTLRPKRFRPFTEFVFYFISHFSLSFFLALFCQKFEHHFSSASGSLQNFSWIPNESAVVSWAEPELPFKSFGRQCASGVSSLSAFSHYALCSMRVKQKVESKKCILCLYNAFGNRVYGIYLKLFKEYQWKGLPKNVDNYFK